MKRLVHFLSALALLFSASAPAAAAAGGADLAAIWCGDAQERADLELLAELTGHASDHAPDPDPAQHDGHPCKACHAPCAAKAFVIPASAPVAYAPLPIGAVFEAEAAVQGALATTQSKRPRAPPV